MSFKVIIPSRYQSTRLPGKPLLDIVGKTMIQRVYEAASLSNASEVIIATDDERIANCAVGFGAKVCMTLATHASGTDRLQEVASKYHFENDEVVVNVQGDEPLIPPKLINQVAENLQKNSWASVASLCEEINKIDAVFNPNNVKVVFNQKGEALYFSRAPIPWSRNGIAIDMLGKENKSVSYDFKNDEMLKVKYFRHIGIYAYRTHFLNEYVKWETSSLENAECLEQLRALDNGHRIHMDVACEPSANGVDTESDLLEIRKLFEHKS